MPELTRTIALWSKTVKQADRLVERRYALYNNLEVITKVDTCDLHRNIESFDIGTWTHFKPRTKLNSADQAIRLMAKDLESKGYRRLI